MCVFESPACLATHWNAVQNSPRKHCVPNHVLPLPPLLSGLDSGHLLLLRDRAGVLLVAHVLSVHRHQEEGEALRSLGFHRGAKFAQTSKSHVALFLCFFSLLWGRDAAQSVNALYFAARGRLLSCDAECSLILLEWEKFLREALFLGAGVTFSPAAGIFSFFFFFFSFFCFLLAFTPHTWPQCRTQLDTTIKK